MFQKIQDLWYYVIEIKDEETLDNLKKYPINPINGVTRDPVLVPYAQALAHALVQGMVTKPGKYAIKVYPEASMTHWEIFEVQEVELGRKLE